MISTNRLTVRFSTEPLFENVNIKFTKGNCYGLIGANGSGKSTFLKILSGQLEPTSGEVTVEKGLRIAVLRQNHFEFDEFSVIETVIMGHKKLYDIMKEKDALYMKPDFNDEDGLKVASLETEFAEMNGWEAHCQAASLLCELGISDEFHESLMKELSGSEKVRVLLAQALFGEPDILLLDEPTNHLDSQTIRWLEEFLINFQNTVIVVSHDRHFLDNVCTHIADIDYQNISLYTGNYTFWQEASQLIQKQKREENRKTEEKMAELKAFIARFSANASKSKQATSRKNMLDKLSLEEIKPSSRKYPSIRFNYSKIPGKDMLQISGLNKTIDGKVLLKNFKLEVSSAEKIVFLSKEPFRISTLFDAITSDVDSDSFRWGVTSRVSYFKKDNSCLFENDLSLIDWLRQFSKEQHISFLRGCLGKMLFSGDDADKKVKILSGGEKVRCVLMKMILEEGNVLIFDEPTNHLDLESITSLNNAMKDFTGTILFTSEDRRLIETVANRIVEIGPNGWIDSRLRYDEYLNDEKIKERREKLYQEKIQPLKLKK